MGLVEMLRLSGTAMLVSDEVSSVIGAIGLIALALSWHKRAASPVRLSQVGWIGVGLYFFNDTFTYMEHDDFDSYLVFSNDPPDGHRHGDVGRACRG
jgi:hypothetical protein